MKRRLPLTVGAAKIQPPVSNCHTTVPLAGSACPAARPVNISTTATRSAFISLRAPHSPATALPHQSRPPLLTTLFLRVSVVEFLYEARSLFRRTTVADQNLHHRINCRQRFAAGQVVVVAENRKHKPPALFRLPITRKRVHVAERPR